MIILWQPGFSKDGSALCIYVCMHVQVCVFHSTCSSYSITNSLPHESHSISSFPLNFSGACSCSAQQTLTETMPCDSCGHSLSVSLCFCVSVYLSSFSPLPRPLSFPSLSLPVSVVLSPFVSLSLFLFSHFLPPPLILEGLPSQTCHHDTVRNSGHIERCPVHLSVKLIMHPWNVRERALCQ